MILHLNYLKEIMQTKQNMIAHCNIPFAWLLKTFLFHHQALVELHEWVPGSGQNTYPQSMDYTDASPK